MVSQVVAKVLQGHYYGIPGGCYGVARSLLSHVVGKVLLGHYFAIPNGY